MGFFNFMPINYQPFPGLLEFIPPRVHVEEINRSGARIRQNGDKQEKPFRAVLKFVP